MTEEVKLDEEVVETNTEIVTPKETSVEPSAIEKRALEMGWRPKEEFEGDEADFIDAQEFVRRKPLFDKIDSVGRELKETRKALQALKTHHEKVKEAEYQHALNTLRAEKKAALEDGDADKLIEIDERIADVKTQRQVEIRDEQVAQNQGPHPNFVRWVDENQWYKNDGELRVAADQIGTSYAANNPGVDPDEVLKYVARRIRKVYPERFQNPNKTKPSAVEGGSSNKPVGKSNDDGDDIALTDEERKAMNTFIRQGILTKEQYLADIKKLRGR